VKRPAPEQKPETLGQLLRYYRKKGGYTQLQFMFSLRDVGYDVVVSTISMWELDQRVPSGAEVFYFVGEALHLSEEEEQSLVDAWIAARIEKDLSV